MGLPAGACRVRQLKTRTSVGKSTRVGFGSGESKPGLPRIGFPFSSKLHLPGGRQTNMTVTTSLIQTLHRINRQKADLQGQLKRGPKVAAMARAKLQAAEAQALEVRAQITKMKVDADHKQLQMKEREDKIHHWNGQLNAAKENREYQALKDQIAADTQANLVLSDEILEILESLDSHDGKLREAEDRVAEVKADCEKIEAQIAGKKVVLEQELERVEAELSEAEKQLSGDFKRDYVRLVAAKGEDAMAALEGNCCSGCYQSLTPQLIEQLGCGRPVACPACGCLIYRDSDS